jgi:hypothetical protein
MPYTNPSPPRAFSGTWFQDLIGFQDLDHFCSRNKAAWPLSPRVPRVGSRESRAVPGRGPYCFQTHVTCTTEPTVRIEGRSDRDQEMDGEMGVKTTR